MPRLTAQHLALLLCLIGCTHASHAQPHAWNWATRGCQAQAQAASKASKASTATIDYPVSCIGFDWNASSARWDSTDRADFTYVSTGGLQERIGWLYNGTTFALFSRESHHYNNLGYDSLTLTEVWTGSAWEPNTKFDRTFDLYGNVTQSIGSAWNGTAWDSSSGYRATFTYHPNTDVASVIQEGYTVGVGWHPEYQQVWSLDGLGRWDTVTAFLPDQGGWKPDKRLVDIHWRNFALLQPDSARFESWDGSAWEDFQRFRVAYSQYDSQEWIYEKPGLGWEPTDRFLLQYDSLGYEVLNEAYSWNGNWELFDGVITHLTYDSLGQRMEVWTEVLSSGSYVRDRRQVYLDFFTSAPLPTPADQPRFLLYPNPQTQSQVLHLRALNPQQGQVHVSIFNAMGEPVHEATLTAHMDEILLPQHLGPGTYLCRIAAKAGAATLPLVILR